MIVVAALTDECIVELKQALLLIVYDLGEFRSVLFTPIGLVNINSALLCNDHMVLLCRAFRYVPFRHVVSEAVAAQASYRFASVYFDSNAPRD